MTFGKGTRWDKDAFSRRKRINDHDKRQMVDYLHAGLNMDKPREELLEELAQKYKRSTRQIERYIAEVSSSDKPIHQDGRVPNEAVQQKAESESEEEARHPEHKWPVQEILVERGGLELAATFKDELSRINALDDAVWQLLGAPWLSCSLTSSASAFA